MAEVSVSSPFRSLAERVEAFRRATLYPVISPEFCGGRSPLSVFEAVIAGGAKAVQIRCKNMEDGELLALVRACRPAASGARALLIVDDRIDIALLGGADGVHLGQTDLPVTEAKKISGELLIGVSTHNESELKKAHADGADYLNIGPVFATQTKNVRYPAVGMEELARLIPMVKMPFSVMGGIKAHHLADLRRLGVRHPAMVTEITQAPDVQKRTAGLIEILK